MVCHHVHASTYTLHAHENQLQTRNIHGQQWNITERYTLATLLHAYIECSYILVLSSLEVEHLCLESLRIGLVSSLLHC